MEAAVIMATVDEPWAVFKIKVSRKGKNSPMLSKANDSLKCVPIFIAASIAPNAPPAPIITNIPPAFSAESCSKCPSSALFQDFLQKKVSRIPMIKAITGSPTESIVEIQALSGVFSMVINAFRAIRAIGTMIGKKDWITEGSCSFTSAAISSCTIGSGILFPA
ncbi:hypothetical protein D3C87_1622330 [compost metagenome]